MKIYPKYKSWCSLRRCILNKPSFKLGFYFSSIQKVFWNTYWRNRRFIFAPKRYSLGFECFKPGMIVRVSDDICYLNQNNNLIELNESRSP